MIIANPGEERQLTISVLCAVTGFLAILLNLILSEEIEDETVSITAKDVDAADDREEWARIQKHHHANADGNGGQKGEYETGSGGSSS